MAVGALAGLGGFTFVHAEGLSYFGEDPAICGNCHVMWPQLDSYTSSSHAHVAVCNDCHLPAATIPKLLSKADNGFFHAWAFTFDAFPEPIRIKPRNHRLLQANCVRCHEPMVHELLHATRSGEAVACIQCHAAVGHAAAPQSPGRAMPRRLPGWPMPDPRRSP